MPERNASVLHDVLSAAPAKEAARYVLAFDTANELIAVGIGRLEDAADAASRSITMVAHAEIEARRASNTQLLPTIDALLAEARIVFPGAELAELGATYYI